MTCGRAGKYRANRLDSLAGSTYHPAHIAAPELEFEDNRSAVGNFREHHVIGKFDQFANDKLEKFSHLSEASHESALHNGYGVTGGTRANTATARNEPSRMFRLRMTQFQTVRNSLLQVEKLAPQQLSFFAS